MFKISNILLNRLIGLFIVAYVIFTYLKPSFYLKPTGLNRLVGGILFGISSGLIGIGGPIRSAFLLTFGLRKATYVATQGAIEVLVGMARISIYSIQGAVLNNLWTVLILCIPITFLGAKVGQVLIMKMPQQQFYKIVSIFLGLVGLKLIIFP